MRPQGTGAEPGAVADAARRRWADRPPTEGFRPIAVEVQGADLLIRFRWRADPHRFAMRVRWDDPVREVAGDGFTAEEAATELSYALMEELDTGFVRRADRTALPDGSILLSPAPAPARWTGWFPRAVPLRHPVLPRGPAGRSPRVLLLPDGGADEPIPDPGAFLAADGLDPGPGRAAARAGTLLRWLTVSRGDLRSRSVAQAVAVRDGPGARIVVVEAPAAPPAALDALLSALLHDLVEGGRDRIGAPADATRLLEFGFRREAARLVAGALEIRDPPDRA